MEPLYQIYYCIIHAMRYTLKIIKVAKEKLMELQRFYCARLNESVVQLSASEAHHLVSVRRLTVGDRVELFDGQGTLAVARIIEAGTRKTSLELEKRLTHPKRLHSRIVIAASIAKAARFDLLITKCTELGIDRIYPVLFERTVKLAKNPKNNDRWANLAISAAKQCRRVFLPQIDKPAAFEKVIEAIKEDYPQGSIVFGSVCKTSGSLINRMFTESDVIAFIGTEGGFTEKERVSLKDYGAEPVRLTDTVLRVETAAISFAAILAVQRDAAQKSSGDT